MSTAPDTDTTANNSKQTKRWRDVPPIHPAAELFPLMGEAELRELADDIKKHGLRDEVTLYLDPDRKNPPSVLEGRNRLDALELLGRETVSDHGGWPPGIYTFLPSHLDPFAYVISKNIHRRHLTPDQGRGLIAKVLKAKPKQSNRQIAKQVKADDKTVAKVRSKLEATAEIPQLTKTTGADGKARPSRRHTEPVPSPPIERKPTSHPAPSKLPTSDEVVESGSVDALCITLAEIAERDPALGKACFEGIVARLLAAISEVSSKNRNDAQAAGEEGTPPAHAQMMLQDGLPHEFIRAMR